jgi:hypothetical protein
MEDLVQLFYRVTCEILTTPVATRSLIDDFKIEIPEIIR